jgi:outer membrane lipopolysaccharide assembly protein LptE/RlpB
MRTWAWVLALAVLSGCGYRFTARTASLPGGLRSARVGMLQNNTAEPNAEGLLTQALGEQLALAAMLGDEGVEAVLTGVVVAVSNTTGLSSRGDAPTYRLTITVQLNVEKGGAVIAATTVTESEEYVSGADALLTEANRAAALRRVVEVVARSATEQLSSGW